MELFVAQLLNGLVYGVLLFLMAAGLSLIFGLMNVVSLAHGSFFMLGAFIGLSIFQLTGSFWAAFVLAPIPVVVLGILLEALFLRPLYHRGHMAQVAADFGFTFVFLDLVQAIWGRSVQRLPAPPSLQGTVQIGLGVFSVYRLCLIALGVAVAVLLWLFLERSRIGAMVRAGVDNAAMAAGLGANIPALFSGIFGFGVALAALGGIAAAPVLGVYPGMDTDILIPAFIVIVIGGMGSLRGAFAGSLLIGVCDTFGKAYFQSVALVLIYLAMIIVLLIRPQGLFGIKYSNVAVAPAITTTIRPTTARTRIAKLCTLCVLSLLPLAMSDYPRVLASEIFIFAIFAMSLDLIFGFTGLMSLGHAAFFGLGAYAVAVLGVQFGLNPWLGVVAGVALAGCGAALIGFFCVRASGTDTCAVATRLLRGAQVARRHRRFRRDCACRKAELFRLRPIAFVGDVLHGAELLCLRLLGHAPSLNAPLGHAFIGMPKMKSAWRRLAIPLARYKLLSFTIAGAIAGLAGGLYAPSSMASSHLTRCTGPPRATF